MRASDYPYFEPGFHALAHRGGVVAGHGNRLENTAAAFAAAVDAGFRYLETDIRATSDGELIALHDPDLDRVTDATGAVAELPYREVAAARVAGLEPVPRLVDLMEAFPDARFNLDLKSDDAVAPLARLVSGRSVRDRVCVSSFSVGRIRAFRRLAGPGVATGASPVGVAWAGYGFGLRGRWSSTGVALQVPARVARDRVPLVVAGMVAAAHRAGRVVHVWTIDDPAEMHRFIDLGVDGLVSDRTDLLKAVLIERGLWGKG